MHEKDIINTFKRVRGEADAPLHRAQLRRTVLSTPASTFTTLQNFLNIISMNKYYLSMGSIAAVVAVAVVVSLSPIDPNVASAQEQVNRAFTRAVQISPAMRAELEANMKADMLKTLEEAKAAPDLTVMTKEEYEKDSQFKFSTGPGPVMGGTLDAVAIKHVEGDPTEAGENIMFTASATAIPAGELHPAGAIGKGTFSAGTLVINSDEAVHIATGTVVSSVAGVAGIAATNATFSAPVKYLSYTDPEGRKTVLGLDKEDTPVFKMSMLNVGDVKEMKGVIEMKAQAVQMIHIEGEPLQDAQ